VFPDPLVPPLVDSRTDVPTEYTRRRTIPSNTLHQAYRHRRHQDGRYLKKQLHAALREEAQQAIRPDPIPVGGPFAPPSVVVPA